jgi:FtsP/CotA-like multicopper oxidase with cupredoxin domain
MSFDRRCFLEMVGVGALAASLPGRNLVFAEEAAGGVPAEPADYTIRIGTSPIELAPDHIVSTTLYNSQFPGPLIRFKEGQRTVVDIYNDTDVPELVHWHGQMIPSDVDGAFEEGSPFVPARGMRRMAFVPKPRGFRFYHTHVVAGADLNRGTYTGQAGPVYIEPKHEPGAYDQEVFLVMKEFVPRRRHGHGHACAWRADQGVGGDGCEGRRGSQRQAQRLRGWLRTVQHQRQDARGR